MKQKEGDSFFVFVFVFVFLYCRFLLVIHFMHISVYMSIPITQFSTPPSPPHRGFRRETLAGIQGRDGGTVDQVVVRSGLILGLF